MIKHEPGVNPDCRIILIAVKGGPHCEWEQAQLSAGSRLREAFGNLALKVCDDLEEVANYLQRGSPIEETDVGQT